MGRPGVVFVFVTVPVLRFFISRKGFISPIVCGMVPMGVEVFVEMGVAVFASPMSVLVFMLMLMGMFMPAIMFLFLIISHDHPISVSHGGPPLPFILPLHQFGEILRL
jgi:hypothetical protein